MKQIIFSKKHPHGLVSEIDEPAERADMDPIKEFFEGLSSADTNSIAKIRSLARAFLEKTEEV